MTCLARPEFWAMRGIAELKLKINVVALVPSTENLPSGTAYKPGDVVKSHLGKTIEIVNTDAEGRLIWPMHFHARRYKPAAMVDAATLTGAVVVALGQQAIGMMGNDGDLQDELRAAGQRVWERCWPMPLWDEYRELIDSNIADMKNSGGRYAGAITGGWFLKEFVDDKTPWAHLDIAGTAYRDDTPPFAQRRDRRADSIADRVGAHESRSMKLSVGFGAWRSRPSTVALIAGLCLSAPAAAQRALCRIRCVRIRCAAHGVTRLTCWPTV
jgi:hypothetical protein